MERSMMKGLVGAAMVAAAGAATAQSSFTIVRPYDGARVREKVKILVPKNSVPAGGYIGVFLDGKLLDATAPQLDATKTYYQYTIDTKNTGVSDGPKKLELKLYVDYGNQSRIVDTSSVDINVQNQGGIRVPDGGVSLRYRWNPGTENVYTLRLRQSVNATQNNSADARAFGQEQEGEGLRLLYAVDNAYSNGDALVRLQVVPNRGLQHKEYAVLTTSNSGGVPKRFYPEDMSPIYMRVSGTGREVFGTVPAYPGFDGSPGKPASLTNLYAAFPLPILPTKPVRPGDSWQTAFQQGALNLADIYNSKTLVEKYPARGEFVGVEWEMGHPCAKIRNSIAQGAAALNGKKNAPAAPTSNGLATAGGEAISDRKVSLEETIYFALDTRQIIKVVRDITIEGKQEAAGGFGGDGAGPSGGPGGRPGLGRPGGPGGRGGRGEGDVHLPGDVNLPGLAPAAGDLQKGRGGPGGFSRPGGPGGPRGRSGAPGSGGPGFGGQGNAPAATYIRIRQQQVFTLVK